MDNDAKRISCTRCMHYAVCSLKEQFKAAQESIDDVCVHIGDNKFRALGDILWIKPVKLECSHYELSLSRK